MTTKGTELPDTIQAIEYFFEQGLTDGLPVVPPTAEAVQAFLEAGGIAPDEVLGTRESRNWIVTAEKVAVNAIMAGCKAEYAPGSCGSCAGDAQAGVQPIRDKRDHFRDVGADDSGEWAHTEEAGHQLRVEPVRARVAGQLDNRADAAADTDERLRGDTGRDG